MSDLCEFSRLAGSLFCASLAAMSLEFKAVIALLLFSAYSSSVFNFIRLLSLF